MLWHATLPLPCFMCLRLICAAYFVAFGVTSSELGGLLLCILKLMIKYTVWYRGKPAGNLCERAALVGDQIVMDSGCILQVSQKLGDQQWVDGLCWGSVRAVLEVWSGDKAAVMAGE